MQNKEGIQKGPQDHAEGQHGSKTHGKFLEQLHSGIGSNTTPQSDTVEHPKRLARHNAEPRLFGDREQHDEAEKKSEKTRLHRELERRGYQEEEKLPGTG
ncbi:MAG: hypothetical protein AUG20_03395 [Gemmatimonas sp. 13_1_20CM_3_60_15]|nr:MAG: hypothetical protein AUG20_03395 [Gemmatimonas sp. 13_1_20CM_3_60_15]